jgi:hypothetical protein
MNELSMRPAVVDFVLASEVLLSPVLRPRHLTAEESGLIAEFVVKLSSAGNPWASLLPIQYSTDQAELDSISRQCNRLRNLLTDDPASSASFDAWIAARIA